MAAPDTDRKVAATNRKARHDFTIERTLEAGLVLTGTEVKSLRAGAGVAIAEAHVGERGGELWLLDAHIPEYAGGNRLNHEPRRARKILVSRTEMHKLIGAVTREGMTLVPLQVYFNPRGLAKLEVGLAKGRKKADKREAIATRDWKRSQARLLAHRG
ncbi:MAG: SsrA-binding protein SmpB [Alphaproteobacteria bacterium]|nr:SsrA-binding protein SmpB [Alphaproteobacteria bacterium]